MIPDVPAVPFVPLVPKNVPFTPLVPDVPSWATPETVFQPTSPVLASTTNTLLDAPSFPKEPLAILVLPDIIRDELLPETNTLPVNWPLNVPVRDDKFDTDDETAVNELDISCNTIKFASISAAVNGLPLAFVPVCLVIIAILYYSYIFECYTSKYKYLKEYE